MHTFPESTRYNWEGVAALSAAQARAIMKAGTNAAEGSPRHKAFTLALEAVEFLIADKDVREFPGAKLKRLLIKAATEAQWLRKEATFKGVPQAQQADHKVCRRCKQEKPRSVFNAVATEAQKRRSNWRVDAQHFISSLLCDTCRKAKTQERNRSERRRLNKTGAIDLIGRYRDSIKTSLATTESNLRNHTVTLPAADGTMVTMYQFDCQEDAAYYRKRRQLLVLARNRLKDRIDDGSLSQPLDDGTSPRGFWQELLEPDEKRALHALHQQGSWLKAGYRGTVPRLWDSVDRLNDREFRRERKERAMPRTALMVGKQPQTPAPVVTPVSDPSAYDPELGF